MKRYGADPVYGIRGMIADVDGEWIRYSDHVEAMKRIAGDGGQQEPICQACKGSGQIATGCDEFSESICKTCDGTGFAASPQAAPVAEREAWAVSLIQAAIDLMTADQIGQWTGVRAFLESSAPSTSPSTYPAQSFAIVKDRTYEGEGPTLAMWNGENYSFSDGDCYEREADGTLDGFDAEWLTHHQLEKRLFACASPAALTDAERDSASYLNMIAQPGFLHYPELKAINTYLQRALLAASPADQVEDVSARIDAMFKNRLTPYGMLVRALRIVANTTLFEMAKYMNISSAELSSMEFGRKEVTQEHINAAARFFMRYGIDTMQPLIAALQTNREWTDAAMSATPPAAEFAESRN